jgi:prephenate dehydrogenase
MGGSLAMSLKGKCARLIGFDPHLPTLELAHSKNILDHAEAFLLHAEHSVDALKTALGVNVIILAAPVTAIFDILKQLPSVVTSTCVLMDIGSTKCDIVQAMSDLPGNFDPIGGHPICGKETLGFEHATANLYQDAPFVVTPLPRTSGKARTAAKQIISAIGANQIEMTAEDHDRALSSTSHLPFLLSSALAHSTPREYSRLIGPGFRSTSRLAGTPSHMMMGILRSNRENILRKLASFRNSLSEFESALQNEDYPALEEMLNQSRHSYQAIVGS